MTTDRYFQWLVKEIGFYVSYHNHKERMAWVATALYVPGIILLAHYTQKMSGVIPCWPCLFAFVAFVLSGIVITFVCEQFRLRSQAADIVVALMQVVNDFCKDAGFMPADTGIPPGKYWPKFVQDEIDRKEGKGRLIATKLMTDCVSYAAIGIATVIAICLVCFCP